MDPSTSQAAEASKAAKKRKREDEDNGFGQWGGYMDAKISKLEEQYSTSADKLQIKKSNLFAGISIYVNGLTDPSANDLKMLMMLHGGVFHHYQRTHTTYIIAANLPDVKIRSITTAKIISPAWVVDCISANRIMDYTKYLLYTNQKTSQRQLGFKSIVKKKSTPVTKAPVLDDNFANIMKAIGILKKNFSEDPEECVDPIQSPVVSRPAEKSKPNYDSGTKTMTAVNPKFLSEFYNNSRLHHIATLGAGFKQYVNDLREQNTEMRFPKRDELRAVSTSGDAVTSADTIIMHIDMDCFFVSVGIRSRPHLRGHPVAVTHSKGGDGAAPNMSARPGVDRQAEIDLFRKRKQDKLKQTDASGIESRIDNIEDRMSMSEIASCSYEARKAGVKNGMFVGQALKLCPNLKTIPYDFDQYKEVAFQLYNIIGQYTLQIEAVSCDEMFVDLTELLQDLNLTCLEFASLIRAEVKAKTLCCCTVGLGGNRLQARLANKKAKPDGQFFIAPHVVEDFMKPISVSDLPGVGYSIMRQMKEQGWTTCADLQNTSLGYLRKVFGQKFGEKLHQFCYGNDSRELVFGQVRKSVSSEVNYGIRFNERAEVETFMRQLCVEVQNRLAEIKRTGKCITLKLMVRAKDAPIETVKYMGHGVCDSLSKSTTLPRFTDDTNLITATILKLNKTMGIAPSEYRGIGIQVSKLNEPNGELAKKNSTHIMQLLKRMPEKKVPINAPQYAVQKSPKKLIPIDSKKPGSSKTVTKKQKDIKSRDLRQMIPAPAAHEYVDLDPSVLAELPDDIRAEVLRDYKQHSRKQVDRCTVEPSPPKSKSVPNIEIRSDSSRTEPNESEKSCDENIFLKDNWRDIFGAWIESSDCPEEFDVAILADHGAKLVTNRTVDRLYLALRYLQRVIEESGKTAWKFAYEKLVDSIQAAMIQVYGCPLNVSSAFPN